MAFLNGIFGNQNQGQNQQQQPRPQGQQTQPSAQGQQQTQQPQNSQVPNQQQQVPGGGGAGPASQQQTQANSQVHPLDGFLQLMTPNKDVLQQRQQQQQQLSAPLFGDLTPDKLKEQVGKTSFTSSIDPQLAQKALQGDHQAFMDVINQATQQAFMASVQMSQGMVEHGVNTGTERFSSTLDSRFRDLQLKSKNSSNPALQHPIGQALLGTVKQQIAAANPRLSPEEVHAKGEELFTQFAQMMIPQQTAGNNAGEQKGETNWLTFLDQPQQ